MAYTIDIINQAAGTSYVYDILSLNAYIIQQGGTGGHTYRIDALNELCTIAGANAGWNYEIDALNAISTAIGGTGNYTYEYEAWTEIASIGFATLTAPSALTVTYASSTSVVLSWTGTLDTKDGYRVYKSTDNVTFTEHGTTTGTSLTVTSLTTDILYYFKVKAYKGGNESAYSNKVRMFTFDSTKTNAWYEPTVAANVLTAASKDAAWYDLTLAKARGATETTGSTVAGCVYEIVTCQANFFYTGNAIGDVFVATAKTLSADNSVKRVLGNHVVQATSTKRPVMGVFDGTKHMQSLAQTFTQPIMCYLIMKQKTYTSGDVLFAVGDSASVSAFVDQNGTTPNIRGFAGAVVNNTGLAVGDFNIVRVLFNSTSSLFRVGTAASTGTNLGTRPASGGKIAIGGDTQGSNLADMDVIAAIFRTVADNDSVQTDIYNYLLSRLPEVPTLTATNYISTAVDLAVTIGNDEYTTLHWEKSTDGTNYTEIATTPTGTASYRMTGLTAATQYWFRCRALIAGVYSAYSSVQTITTFRKPFVLTSDQTTLNTVTFSVFNVVTGHTVRVNWGDGVWVDYTGDNSNITKNYSTTGTKTITIDGDTNYISYFEAHSQQNLTITYTGLTAPTSCIGWHCYSTNAAGEAATFLLSLPATNQILHIGHPVSGYSRATGDITSLVFPNSNRDFHTEGNNLTADVTGWRVKAAAGHLYFDNQANITGSLTNFTASLADPTKLPVSLQIMNFNSTGVTGDFSGVEIPTDTNQLEIGFQNCGVTKMFRGAYERLIVFNFYNCQCNQAEIDAVLAAIEARLTTNAPLFNCTYNFSGAGMGTPSATGLDARTAILGLYTTAGKTCTITVNS